MPDSFLIWGGGGHGRVVADLIRALGYTVAGYVDRDAGKLHCVVEPGGARVMFTDDVLLAQLSSAVMQGTDPRTQQTHGDAFALAIGDNAARHACFERLAGFDVPSLIHPSAICSPSARVGRGTVVFPAAVINAGAQIGDVAIVNSGAIIEHDCVLGDAVHVSPGATLGGTVRVGARSWIGAGATIIHGITVGADVTVGAGAVIIRDVPDSVTIVGNPGRVVRQRNS